MSRCPACAVRIEGSWERCPLCETTLAGAPTEPPFPAVPLVYHRRRLVRVLVLCSAAVIVASFAAQLLFDRRPAGIGALRSVWLGVATMWLVVLTAIRGRHSIAGSTVLLVVLVSAISCYWDFLTGWRGWSLTYAVPIVAACSIVALLITVRVLRTDRGDHVLASAATVLFGLVPVVFLALGWVSTPLPSIVCGLTSALVLGLVQLDRLGQIRDELARRLHV